MTIQNSPSGYCDPYHAEKSPQLIEAGETHYIIIDHVVTAESSEAMAAVTALNALSTRVHEEAKKTSQEYSVFPLEGIWNLTDKSIGFKHTNIRGKFMIKQPLFLNEENFNRIKEETIETLKDKDYASFLHDAKFEIISEGKNVQMLHRGPYSKEAPTFDIMEEFAQKNKLTRVFQEHHHREIYLKDIQKTNQPEQFETILRFQVR